MTPTTESWPTADYDRPPDVAIVATCDIDEGSFADVDSDGVDDLVVRAGLHVFSWPSSHGIGDPLVWTWSGVGNDSSIDISSPNSGPPWVQWRKFDPEQAFESEVDASTLALIERGSGPQWAGTEHVGDVDGDGTPDLVLNGLGPDDLVTVRASSTGVHTAVPGWGELPTTSFLPYQYYPKVAWSMGDLNHDGYDDLLVAQRDGEGVTSADGQFTDEKQWGPAQLYLGSPTGIEPEPLWTLFAPDHPKAGVGRGAAALPDERSIVVTVVTEGLYYADFSPELLAVIRDADTPDAYFDEEMVQVPEFNPTGFTPYLYGWMDELGGEPVLTMTEVPYGVSWFPWHADGTGFQANSAGVAIPRSGGLRRAEPPSTST